MGAITEWCPTGVLAAPSGDICAKRMPRKSALIVWMVIGPLASQPGFYLSFLTFKKDRQNPGLIAKSTWA